MDGLRIRDGVQDFDRRDGAPATPHRLRDEREQGRPPVSQLDGGDVHDAMMLDLSKRGGVGKGRSERRSRWTKSDKSAATVWRRLSRDDGGRNEQGWGEGRSEGMTRTVLDRVPEGGGVLLGEAHDLLCVAVAHEVCLFGKAAQP